MVEFQQSVSLKLGNGSICAIEQVSFGSSNSLSPGRNQPTNWSISDLFVNWRRRETNLVKRLIKIQAFPFTKMHLKWHLQNDGHFIPTSVCYTWWPSRHQCARGVWGQSRVDQLELYFVSKCRQISLGLVGHFEWSHLIHNVDTCAEPPTYTHLTLHSTLCLGMAVLASVGIVMTKFLIL